MDEFYGKRYFVYGNGVSGHSACRAIKKRGGKVRIYSDDCGNFVPPQDADYTAAVISPGIKPTHPVYEYCVAHGIKTLSEVEIGFRLAECPIVGVTGTNGKTTTTRLIADMLGAKACGNIGYPISAAAEKTEKALVCELSSFQLYGANISPSVAVITNITADHLDWHGTAEEYYRCKCNIANGMNGGYLVLGGDIPVAALKTLRTGAEIVRCSTEHVVDGAYIADGYFCFYGSRVCPIDYLRLSGKHNIKNALVAIAAAKCMGAENSAVLSALSSASAAPHRIADLGSFCGKRWVDDSKGTNISACLAAIESTSGTLCLIVGGRGKGLDFSELFNGLDERVIDIIAMGESAEEIRDCAEKCGFCGRLTVADGLASAVKAAEATSADVVLLSPACASFDEFDNYSQRGERFKALVTSIGKSDEK